MASNINDLPTTSPHGSDFGATRKFLELQEFERCTRHRDGTPRHVLRHPRKPPTIGLRGQISLIFDTIFVKDVGR